MKKRLRKKLRLGEFREFGFIVRFHLSDQLDEAALDQFWDAFIGEAIEAQTLACGGGCGRIWNVFVTRAERGSATEVDRAHVSTWLQQHPDVSEIEIGPLVDAWVSG